MNSPVLGLRVAAALFALFCLIHVVRVVVGMDVVISGHVIPNVVSLAPAIVGALLALWMWRLATRAAHPTAS